MEKPEGKKRQITFQVPLTGYPRTMRFNRFALEDMGHYCVAHCGFIGKQGVVCDLFSFAMAAEDIQVNRDNTLLYIDRMTNTPDVEPEEWVTPSTSRNIEVVRIVASSSNGNNAELILATFSFGAFLTKSQSTAEKLGIIEPQPVAMLTCDASLQKHVLTKLFLEKHAS